MKTASYTVKATVPSMGSFDAGWLPAFRVGKKTGFVLIILASEMMITGSAGREEASEQSIRVGRVTEVYQGSWTGPLERRGCAHVIESSAV